MNIGCEQMCLIPVFGLHLGDVLLVYGLFLHVLFTLVMVAADEGFGWHQLLSLSSDIVQPSFTKFHMQFQ